MVRREREGMSSEKKLHFILFAFLAVTNNKNSSNGRRPGLLVVVVAIPAHGPVRTPRTALAKRSTNPMVTRSSACLLVGFFATPHSYRARELLHYISANASSSSTAKTTPTTTSTVLAAYLALALMYNGLAAAATAAPSTGNSRSLVHRPVCGARGLMY